MLATRKATRGFIVTILNYDTYQNLDNYKSDTTGEIKATQERHGSDRKATEKRHYKQECNNDNNGNNVNTLHKKPEGIDSFFTTEKYTLQQFTDKAVIAGLSDDEATEAYHHFRAQGFNRGNGQPLLSIESGLVIWARNRHKFALKTEPDEDQRKKKVRERSERILKNARHTG